MSDDSLRPVDSASPSSENTNLADRPEKAAPLIGSQRAPDAYRAKPTIKAVMEPLPEDEADEIPIEIEPKTVMKLNPGGSRIPEGPVPIPKIRGRMSDDLEDEFEQIFGGKEIEMNSIMGDVDKVASQEILEPETKLKAKIVSISGENVFVDLGSKELGIVPGKMFKTEPKAGDEIEVIVLKFDRGEGVYDLAVPLAAADVREWEQVSEGMILNAKIVKVNTGGLECEVNKLRGFIPMGQIGLYRVEKPETLIGESFACVVMEVNPMRRNLILSRRSMLEREREENREKILAELEVGQVREGVVRKLIDSGAFVDLGGLDGFIPISALSWGRVNHPQDVLKEGERIKVKVTKLDQNNHRISLAYRDDASDPWNTVEGDFPVKTSTRGRITKIMDFGAFVELTPGVEGLVHISEISHKRIAKVGDAVREGDWVEVMIQSIDPVSKRISLSMKQLIAPPEPEPREESEGAATGPGGKKGNDKPEVESVPQPLKLKHEHKGPLKGGTGGSGSGEKFGLKW